MVKEESIYKTKEDELGNKMGTFIRSFFFVFLIIFFFLLSYSPTLLDLSYQNKLFDTNREFVLEHNYYWPDFNLYLSKIRQGYEGHLLAKERYTTEPHTGSLVQWVYVLLGITGKTLGLSIPWSYQLGRILFAPLLLIIILAFIRRYFRSFTAQVFVFIITLTAGSLPRFFTDAHGLTRIGRYMEWWSNMDALQRITHLPHILLAQVISFFLLYRLSKIPSRTVSHFLYVILGNFLGIIFPPSLMTLDLVFFIHLIYLAKNRKREFFPSCIAHCIFIFFTLPSLLYIFFLTKTVPWSALIDAHKMTRMPIALDQFILATGPIFYLATAGIVTLIIQRKKEWYTLIYFVIATFVFASYFSFVNDQSPLRFTQTGLFIPLGLLGSYFLINVWRWVNAQWTMHNGQLKVTLKTCYILFVICFVVMSLTIMKSSYDWQEEFIVARANADHPPVPYPPQTLHPLTGWMDAIRFLGTHTLRDDAVIAQISAANYIPAYAGNTVWWGQTNTYDYFRKQKLMEDFFKGNLSQAEALHLIAEGNIKYVFVGPQEKDMLPGKKITSVYPFLDLFFDNGLVQIYSTKNK